MKTEIITIGDEILIGQTIDTNSAWIGEQLSINGIGVDKITSIHDNKDDILDALSESEKNSDIVLITGGLGPTKDDITKHTLCEYFDTDLVMNEDVLRDITHFFEARGREMLQVNIDQALLPSKCKVIRNYVGTASGMWFEKNNTIFISMPGVPYEMKKMMSDSIIPELIKLTNSKKIYHKTIYTQGIGESFLAEKIKYWEDSLYQNGLKLAYLPSPGMVKLRVTSEENNKTLVEQKVIELMNMIPKYAFSTQTENIAEVVGKLLTEKNKTLATAESCTGGYIAHLITSIPGSSSYYQGSLVTYSYDFKEELLGVNRDDIEKSGAVSETVVDQMVRGACKKLKVDYAIAASGIAGPGGGTEEKPVGTVWVGVGTKDKTWVKKFNFGNNRERNIVQTALSSLNMLRLFIKDNETI